MFKRYMRWAMCFCLALVVSHPAWAGNGLLTKGTVYVPVYSNIYTGPKARPLGLMAILSIRNIDTRHGICITQADYYNNKGDLLKHYVPQKQHLSPLGSMDYIVPEKDKAGGVGANFIVTWTSDQPVNEPIIQALMISTRSSLGISFICPGKRIEVAQ